MKKNIYQQLTLPAAVDNWIAQSLTSSDIKRAKNIKLLSDHFHKNQMTPWDLEQYKEAYLSYFFPLNLLRNIALIDRIKNTNLLNSINHIIEVGSGCGASLLSLYYSGFDHIKYDFYEISEPAILLNKKIVHDLQIKADCQWHHNKTPDFEKLNQNKTLLLFSYSLNEFKAPPEWIEHAKNLLIIEPSTQTESRKLMNLRQQLIEKNFNALAPCMHNKSCPLLTHSKSDWCHDRIHIEMPGWFTRVENHLPMKNRTLTFSYLAMSQVIAENSNPRLARVTGDSQVQKGKTIQMFCQNDEKTFLCWLKKNKNTQHIPRGAIIEIDSDFEKKGNEIRAHKEIKIN